MLKHVNAEDVQRVQSTACIAWRQQTCAQLEILDVNAVANFVHFHEQSILSQFDACRNVLPGCVLGPHTTCKQGMHCPLYMQTVNGALYILS